MENKRPYFKMYLIAVLMCSYTGLTFGQTNTNTHNQVQFVFDRLISVYGSAKTKPEFKIVKKGTCTQSTFSLCFEREKSITIYLFDNPNRWAKKYRHR